MRIVFVSTLLCLCVDVVESCVSVGCSDACICIPVAFDRSATIFFDSFRSDAVSSVYVSSLTTTSDSVVALEFMNGTNLCKQCTQ